MRAPERRRRLYYRGAADHWRGVIDLQVERLREQRKRPAQGVETRADMDFYVVAVQRLRNVAKMARDRLPDSDSIRKAMERFDERWPLFRAVRDYAEHITGPGSTVPGGAWYFSDAVMAAGRRGAATYLVDVEDTTASADQLYRELSRFLGSREELEGPA
jgi:hypothetical protein